MALLWLFVVLLVRRMYCLTLMAESGGDSWRLRGEIKQVIKSVIGKGFYRPDNEFLIDVALACSHSVNLAY